MTAQLNDYASLVERLRALVIIDEVGSDNPLGREAADAIEALVKQRDEQLQRLDLVIKHSEIRD